jgi:hypothetical protein
VAGGLGVLQFRRALRETIARQQAKAAAAAAESGAPATGTAPRPA